ncbi:hypothetical protein B0T19DRAFT_238848 [Cercophora scortea]|uniref:Uncharacterized protein n=1 Tax=Cercophora scortea TaxID=314031 RepID=A0AAE0IHE6_9PEZI|nr:hypothetical protein B0T19DRAFT_238848 [Cercophora scortea]
MDWTRTPARAHAHTPYMVPLRAQNLVLFALGRIRIMFCGGPRYSMHCGVVPCCFFVCLCLISFVYLEISIIFLGHSFFLSLSFFYIMNLFYTWWVSWLEFWEVGMGGKGRFSFELDVEYWGCMYVLGMYPWVGFLSVCLPAYLSVSNGYNWLADGGGIYNRGSQLLHVMYIGISRVMPAHVIER